MWTDWELFAEEHWLDLNDTQGQRRFILGRVAACLRPARRRVSMRWSSTNVDGYSNATGRPISEATQLLFNTALSNLVYANGLAAALKDDLEQMPELLPYFDMAVNEQCQEFQECGSFTLPHSREGGVSGGVLGLAVGFLPAGERGRAQRCEEDGQPARYALHPLLLMTLCWSSSVAIASASHAPQRHYPVRALLEGETGKEPIVKLFVTSAFVLTSVAAWAAGLPCSVHPTKHTSPSKLLGLARVTHAEAQRTAFASIDAPPAATVKEGELEIEQGCLVYSFDIRVPGRSGIDEVMVDAGTGKALSHTHETPRDEAAERAADRAASKRR
jgi:hypothetical protein